ncbi:MAG: DUF1272 domain-containing protein [Bacteroidota bacterium]
MLELRPNCENCGEDLPPDSPKAVICSYECTYCDKCAQEILKDVCPNCGGNFTPRPIRPKEELIKNPASTKMILKPFDYKKHREMYKKYEGINPLER